MLIKSNKLYDALKFIAQIVLPAAGALYFGLAQIWGFPNANEVVGTIVVIDTFLGALLGISSAQYNNSEAKYDGTATVLGEETVNLNVDPLDFHEKDELLLKVEKPRESA